MPAVPFDRLAVAALSARWLAQSALRGGRRVVALDLFGDLDTRRAGAAWHAIGDLGSLRVDAATLAQTLRSLHAAGSIDGWIAGPGCDALRVEHADALATVPQLGNPAAVVAAVRDPRRFFALLDALALSHPEVAFAPPADPSGWLRKDAAGSGGWHIDHATARSMVDAGCYFQRREAGRPLSALFVAAGGRARVIGCAQQLIEAHAGRPYVYAGVIGPITLPPALAAWVEQAVQSIVAATGLVGLNGIDFLADGERGSVLEVNPRPSASVEVYDPALARGLVELHVDACVRNRLPDGLPLPLAPPPVHGTRIVFAACALQLDRNRLDRLHALDFAADLPFAPQAVPAGAPLCSVTATGVSVAVVERLLAQRAGAIRALFDPPMEHELNDRIAAGQS